MRNRHVVFDFLRARLRKGSDEYGNDSFLRGPVETSREIQEEVIDVAGWCFVLWVQVKQRFRYRDLTAALLEDLTTEYLLRLRTCLARGVQPSANPSYGTEQDFLRAIEALAVRAIRDWQDLQVRLSKLLSSLWNIPSSRRACVGEHVGRRNGISD